MNCYLSTNPNLFEVADLVDMIKNGKILILKYIQRGFVWSSNKILKLFESIKKKYPVGILIFWEINGGEELIENYFNPLIKLDHLDYSNAKYIVIDGYQRLTSLILIHQGKAHVVSRKGGYTEKRAEIYYNPINDVYDLKTRAVGKPAIPLKDILNNEIHKYYRELREYVKDEEEFSNIIDKLHRLRTEFEKYGIPAYILNRRKYDLLDVIDIFDRINSKGTKVQLNQITLAYLAAHLQNIAEDIFNFLAEFNNKSYKITVKSILRALSYLTVESTSI